MVDAGSLAVPGLDACAIFATHAYATSSPSGGTGYEVPPSTQAAQATVRL